MVSSITPSSDARQPQYAPLQKEDTNESGSAAPLQTDGTEDHRQNNLSGEKYKAYLAMGKILDTFAVQEREGAVTIEKDSVYGGAISIPQIGRSADWPISMVILALRTYMFLILNFFVQYMAVYYIYDEQTNMSPFAGQMHLCNFGAGIAQCPGGVNCIGPGGTDYETPGRLYSYDIWSTRVFVRDSLGMLFPDRKDEINSSLDPGEYGVESHLCRFLCIFVFMLQIADEFQDIMDMCWACYLLPTEEQTWIQYEPPTWGDKEYVKAVHDRSEVDMIQFRVAGMPLKWKVLNIFLVLIPRIILWKNLSFAGVYFLMETASMVDQIVNTTALSFIFSFDELVVERLFTKSALFMMSNMQDYTLYDPDSYEKNTDQEILDRYMSQELTWARVSKFWKLVPRRLFITIALMVLFVADYYLTNCNQGEDGSWHSKDISLPKSAHLNPLCLFMACFEDRQSPIWTMPKPEKN